MARYVDADELISKYGKKLMCNEITSEEYYAIKIPLDYAPTADVVEAVRCKDCKYFRSGADAVDDWMECSELFISLDSDDGYCAWAKKRGGDAT